MDDKQGKRDAAWTSDGLARREAVDHWRNYFAQRHTTPVEVSLYDAEGFTARLINRGVGQLRVLRLQAPAQRVVHHASPADQVHSNHLMHLIYMLRGPLRAITSAGEFTAEPGECVLIDNSRYYELDMRTAHEAIDLIMPVQWLEQYVPNPLSRIGKALSLRTGWGPPLGAMIETISVQAEDFPVPRPVLAEQLGSLLALAMGAHEPTASRPFAKLAQQIMRRIESDFADPELSPDRVATDLRISKRYLQTLLANSGTSFVRELNAIRLDRASDMLADPRSRSLSIAEIAFRCGFLDPGYFTRLFRKRFDATPRAWREMS